MVSWGNFLELGVWSIAAYSWPLVAGFLLTPETCLPAIARGAKEGHLTANNFK